MSIKNSFTTYKTAHVFLNCEFKASSPLESEDHRHPYPLISCMATRLCSCTLPLLLLLLALKQSPLHASDTLTTNQQLSGNQKLISQDGSFALGFFQPAGESQLLYHVIDIKMNKF